ncbi:MAG TPA: lysophospholipid acyltransferase family protein [bacterium]|nr:lysophospholipid acyltransferase family protein [bacterium]HPN44306.1 lysophospholipid acyltransferase family protein [bacterium]
MNKKQFLNLLAMKLAWLFIMALGKSAIKSAHNRKYLHQAYATGKPIMFVIWHGKMLLPMYAHRNEGVAAMVSEHNDGEIIARAMERFGYRTVRGSSTRGGTKAYRNMLKVLKSGNHCTMTPDGPTGPRYVFKIGALQLAQRAGAVLLPLTFSAKNPVVLKSWDAFTLWKPFGKVCLAYGPPLFLPDTADADTLELCRLDIQQRMMDLQKEADDLFRK